MTFFDTVLALDLTQAHQMVEQVVSFDAWTVACPPLSCHPA